MGLRLGLSLWGSTVGHPSNCWASCYATLPKCSHFGSEQH